MIGFISKILANKSDDSIHESQLANDVAARSTSGLVNGKIYDPISGNNVSLLSDVTVANSESSVLSIAAAYRCIAVRSEAIAMLTGDILEVKDGRRTFRNDSTAYQVLFRRPNDWMTPFEWKRLLAYNKLVTGYGFGTIESRDSVGCATCLGISKFLQEVEFEGDLYYYDQIKDKVYHHTDVIILREIGPNGMVNSPLTIHRNTFGKVKAANELENNLYTNKMFLGAALTFPENVKFKFEDKENLSAHISKNYGGVNRSGRVLVLDQGAKVTQFQNAMSLADAEYIQSANLSIEDICRIFGVQPYKVFHFNKITYNSMEHMAMEFVQSAVMPDVMQLEQELNYKLFSPYQRKRNYEVKYDLRSIMRADSAAMATWITKMVSVGGLTVNEVRELDDRNPVPGGDEAFIQANNYFPLSKMAELAQAMIEEKSNVQKSTNVTNDTPE